MISLGHRMLSIFPMLNSTETSCGNEAPAENFYSNFMQTRLDSPSGNQEMQPFSMPSKVCEIKKRIFYFMNVHVCECEYLCIIVHLTFVCTK